MDRNPLNSPSKNQPNEQIPRYSVRGDLLSCFTTSIASYMQSHGMDYELAIGSQLFLAIRIGQHEEPKLAFAHYFTPLSGEHPTHTLALARESAAQARDAICRVVEECKKTGSVIVVGDASRLPWQVTHGKKRAPHWFLVDGLNEQARTLHVTDLFEFIDERGEQRAFSGWIPFDQLEEIIPVNTERNAFFEHRERWAFGDEEDAPKIATGTYQWFQARTPNLARPVTNDGSLELLRDTYRCHGQSQYPSHLPHPQWICGLDAVRRLPDYFAAHLNDPSLYHVSDDLWVAARSRLLFALVLARLGRLLNIKALGQLAARCEEQLAPQWLALPRIMHYNASCLQRGRPPRSLLVEVMSKIADEEQKFMDQLGAVLGDC